MVPILLITGFLGSGKTTFLNWLLEKKPDLKISVILNEFGNTQLETQFVKKHSEDIMELANGCMCCVAKSDVPRVITYILEHSPNTEYILIEASGLSDPDPVRNALQTAPINQYAYLENTVCVIDVINYEQMNTEHSIISSQIADADLVLLNKTNQAGQEKTQHVSKLISRLTPDIRLIEFQTSLPAEIFLTKEGPKKNQAEHHPHHHQHQHYSIYVYHTNYPMQLDKLHMTIRNLPQSIVRVKGVVRHKINNSIAYSRIQRVGSHTTIDSHQTINPIEKSTILTIGQQLDQKQLKEKFDSCIVKA